MGFKTLKAAKEMEYELTHNIPVKEVKKSIFSYEDVALDFLNFKNLRLQKKLLMIMKLFLKIIFYVILNLIIF